MASRLAHALETGALSPPALDRAVFLEPPVDFDPSVVQASECQVQQGFKPLHDAFAARGVPTSAQADGTFDLAHVSLARSRDLNRGLIAQAEMLAPQGLILVEGAKTDGIDSILKALKGRVSLAGQVSKAHGKLAWFTAQNVLQDWALPPPAQIAGGWVTQAGVFSADGPDDGSVMLADILGDTLKGAGADLGGGWGYLSARLCDSPKVTRVDVVEANARALACARLNATDPRVHHHWADATAWGEAGSLDWVVSNPPFHKSRAADPALGQAFIASAARLLKPHGTFTLVANRHLPYETTLTQHFTKVQEVAGDARFKVLRADRPGRISRR